MGNMDNQRVIELLLYAQTSFPEFSYGAIKIAMDKAIKALEKQIPKRVVSDGNDEMDWVRCPICGAICGDNESAYDMFYDENGNHDKVVYCMECGQALICN